MTNDQLLQGAQTMNNVDLMLDYLKKDKVISDPHPGNKDLISSLYVYPCENTKKNTFNIWLDFYVGSDCDVGNKWHCIRLYPLSKYKHIGSLMALLRIKFPEIMNKYSEALQNMKPVGYSIVKVFSPLVSPFP